MLKTTTLPRQFWQNKIIPFGVSPEAQCFPVGWTTYPQNFEEITDTLRPQILKDLLYFRKISREYISDLLQQGWLRLWQALHKNMYLLAQMTCLKAADFVVNRCGATQLRDYIRRYDSYHTLSNWADPDADVYEDTITEIVTGSSLKSTHIERHARFTRIVDRLLDVKAAIHKVAVWCADDIRKLAALYYLTTSVSQTDAGRIAGLPVVERKGRKPRCFQMQHWCKLVLARLQEELGNYKPIEPTKNDWRESLKAGNTEPVVELSYKYTDQPDRLLALYALTTGVARQTIVDELGANDSGLWYAMKQVRQELRCMYARRMPKSA